MINKKEKKTQLPTNHFQPRIKFKLLKTYTLLEVLKPVAKLLEDADILIIYGPNPIPAPETLSDQAKLAWALLPQVPSLFRPLLENELLDMPVEQFLASLHFEQRGKLDQSGVNFNSIE